LDEYIYNEFAGVGTEIEEGRLGRAKDAFKSKEPMINSLEWVNPRMYFWHIEEDSKGFERVGEPRRRCLSAIRCQKRRSMYAWLTMVAYLTCR
jgi:hypothetical protein